MKLPDLSYLALPDGVLFQLNKKPESARATSQIPLRLGPQARRRRRRVEAGVGACPARVGHRRRVRAQGRRRLERAGLQAEHQQPARGDPSSTHRWQP